MTNENSSAPPRPVRVGVFGTSWWADTMYLPPLAAHPMAIVVAVCGRDPERTRSFADQWEVPGAYVDPEVMLSEADLDAVIIAAANDSHHDLTMAALERGLHVLCEKPMAMSVAEASAMQRRADEVDAITLMPFTYHWMPANQWVGRLIADGYVGRPLHINARYYTDFGFDPAYSWRFDRAVAGSGLIGDLGSHWIHLARWLLDDTERSVSALASNFVTRDARPDGAEYDQTEDSVVMTIRYQSGAYAVLHTSAVCHEGTPFGQTHHYEIHGDQGTLYATCDWDTVQRVEGLRRGDTDGRRELPIPDDIWNGVRRDTVHNTYRDVFRSTSAMTRQWVDAIVSGEKTEPSFAEGLAVQRVLDAAVASAASGGSSRPIPT